MKYKVLDPGKVGIASWRRAELPAAITAKLVAAPIAIVERWIGNNVIGPEVFVGVVEERAFVVPFNLRAVDAANGEVHLGQPPGRLVALLSEDGNVIDAALVLFHKPL